MTRDTSHDLAQDAVERAARERAVVLGGSIAGLLAARVLADHFDEVVVVDRDDLDGLGPRRGVPQARHIHALLASGQTMLEARFPGLTAALVLGGAPVGDMLDSVRVCLGGHRFARGQSGLPLLCVSRPRLEDTVRAWVRTLDPVVVAGGRDVGGLVTDRDGCRVTGVRLISRADGVAEDLAADLVVDATGRGSRLPRWLEAADYAPPPVEQHPVRVTYVSCEYRLPPGALDGDLGVLCAPTPDVPFGGALSRLEDEGCVVTLIGMVGHEPPTRAREFGGFTERLLAPDLARALDGADLVGDPVVHRHPTSLRRRYDRLRRFPAGLAVLGDAVCTLNPIYGQGMTVAAMQAEALDRALAGGRPLDPRGFLQALIRTSAPAWSLAKGADLSFPQVGRASAAERLLGRYVERLQSGAERDPRLGRAFLRVTSLVDPPAALFRPSILGAVATAHGRPAHPCGVTAA